MDPLTGSGGAMATAMILAEWIGNAFKVRKDILAVVLGVGTGVLAYYMGTLEVNDFEGLRAWLYAAGVGLNGGLAAMGAHGLQKQARAALGQQTTTKLYSAERR